MTASSSAEPIPYASFAPPRKSAKPAIAILFGGLALILLGGCFLIGAMMTINGTGGFTTAVPPSPLTSAQTLFVATMYLIAGVCFAAAAFLLFLATRALLRLSQS